MGDTTGLYGAPEGTHHRILPDDGVEGARAPLAVKRDVRHLESDGSVRLHTVSIAEASPKTRIKMPRTPPSTDPNPTNFRPSAPARLPRSTWGNPLSAATSRS